MQDRRKLAAQIGAVAAPLLAVAAARVLLAPLPGASAANSLTPVSGPGAMSAPPAVRLTAAQQRAVEWSERLPREGLTSPLCRRTDRQPGQGPMVVVRPDPSRGAHQPATSDLRLTAIMGGAQTGMVLINGKLYREGDEVKPGLTLRSIDARNNRITLADARGEYVLGRVEE